MLSSRNRSLKRRSRIGAFFVIVGAGCVYRFKQFYNAVSEYSSSDEFVRESPLVPESVRTLHAQSKEVDLRETLTELSGKADLPAQSTHELEFREQRQIPIVPTPFIIQS